MNTAAVAISFWIPIASVAAASSLQARFDEAQSLFESAKAQWDAGHEMTLETRERFHESATRFAQLARSGVRSENLYVNAGNAYHFAGDDARALLWYLRAADLANTPETRTGVAALRRELGAERWPPTPASIGRAMMFWHDDLNRRTKRYLLWGTYPLGCALLAAGLLAPRRRRAALRIALTLMLVGAAIGVSDVVARLQHNRPWAVVLEPSLGRAGDGDGYSVVAESIPPGQEVKLIESREHWVRVALPSGTTCWLPRDACEPL